MKKYGLIGSNIQRSLSPLIHKTIGDCCGVELSYEILDIEKGKLNHSLLKKYDGLNVTIPHKIDVLEFLDFICTEISAVNTIQNDNGRLSGYNTDFDGFVFGLSRLLGIWTLDLGELSKEIYSRGLNGRVATILGSGGASKVSQYVLNRLGFKVEVVSRAEFSSFEFTRTHLLINATPMGSAVKSPLLIEESRLSGVAGIFDLTYTEADGFLSFRQVAQNLGIPFENGLSMLVAQAIKAQSIWNPDRVKYDEGLVKKVLDIINQHKHNKNQVEGK